MKPKISIIIPVYKVEKYLRQCLDSVINQTLKDIEIIIVDEGDIDECRKIIDEYESKDSRIIAIHQKNGGLANARNRGLQEANAEYIIFTDSDDWIALDTAEVLYNDIISSGADFVVCGTNIKFSNFEKRFVRLNWEDKDYFEIKEGGVRNIRNSDFGKINVAAWNKIFKKSLIDKYNIDFPNNLNNEDACFFWKYMAVSEKVYFEPKKLYNYLRRDDSLMMQTFNRKFDKKVLDHLKILKKFYDFLIQNNLYEKCYEGFWNCFKISAEYSLRYASNDNITFVVRKFIFDFLSDKYIDKTKLKPNIAECLNKYKTSNEFNEVYTKEIVFLGFPILSYKKNAREKKLILFNFIPLVEIKGGFKDVQRYKNYNNFADL